MFRSSIAKDEELQKCYELRASEYGRLYRNIQNGAFSDAFDTATTIDGKQIGQTVGVWENDAHVGTLRLVLARHPDYPGLKPEVMEFDWAVLANVLESCARI